MDDVMVYAPQIDTTMRNLGYSRIASNELVLGTQICKILTYQGLGLEEFMED